ncbi:hypothetical protein AncyloWKF20_09390 [Ancylobacter sp. WKF20]|uniref:hypothetical protein n=1 Tax=Ancylobacter sp. WKF20 TaxID=3039801 RepID=UPI0024342C04|nr:hypothetical protein [Ancylobacter sp. WKF20]WGD32008.1 hypothetical protein AncyloWKF20_09390 [Ancylobacter sp. WKF20]
MAVDEERLVVALEARIRDFERNFDRAQKTADRKFKAIEDRAKRSAGVVSQTFANLGRGTGAAFGAIGATAGISGLGIAGLFAGAKTAAADLARVAAEAQKAGVGVEAFQELGYAAQGALVDIDALTDGLKEMQLRADEFIVTGAGGGAEAFQRLGYTADELKEKLADPAALFEEIIGKLGRLDKAAQIRIADELFGGTGGEQFVRLLDRGNGYIAKMRQEARDTGNVLDAELVQRAAEIDRAFARLSTTVGTNLKGALVGVVALMRDFSDMLNRTETQSADTLKRRIDLIDAAVANARKSSLAFMAIGGDAGIASRLAERDQLQAQLDSRPKTSLTVNKPGGLGDLSKIETASTKKADQLAESYRQIVTAAEQRITQMGVEQQALGLTTAEAERLRVKQDLLNEAQRAGITLTAEQADKLNEIAERSGAAAAALEQAAMAQAALIDRLDMLRGTSYDALSGFVDDIRAGVDASDALANALDTVMDRLIDIALQSALTGLFGASGTTNGGALGGVLSSIFGGYKASGGPVAAGKAYVVGERGPEMLVPRQSGFIIPNDAMGQGTAAPAKLTVNVHTLPGTTAEVSAPTRQADGTTSVDVVINQVKRAVASDIMTRGDIGRAIESRYGANPAKGQGR